MTNTYDPSGTGGGGSPAPEDDELTPEELAELEAEGNGDEGGSSSEPSSGAGSPVRRFELTTEEENEISEVAKELKRQAEEEAAIRMDAIDRAAEARRKFLIKKKEDEEEERLEEHQRRVAEEAAEYAPLFGLNVDNGTITGLADDPDDDPRVRLRGSGRRVPPRLGGADPDEVIDQTNGAGDTPTQPIRTAPGGGSSGSGSSGGGGIFGGFFGR